MNKSSLNRNILLLGVWAIIPTLYLPSLNAQNSSTTRAIHLEKELPKVFQIGEHEGPYETLMSGLPTLLDACNGDMEVAYNKLTGMMQEMQDYARKTSFDLNGINAWMHFFWNPDGSILHIGYYLKPNSKNVNQQQLTAFLEGFAKTYKLPLRHSKRFSHYSSFSFPLASLPVQDSNRMARSSKAPSGN